MQHYTWFLSGAILILLAIIGYYADKTNFGQGKNNSKNIDKKDSDNLDKDLINKQFMDNINLNKENDINSENNNLNFNITPLENEEIINQNLELNSQPAEQEMINQGNNSLINQDKQVTSSLVDDSGLNSFDLVEESDNTHFNEENQIQEKDSDLVSLTDSSSNEMVKLNQEDDIKPKKIDNVLINIEELKDFDDEFDMLLPKKELISDDLLSDIDDLELGKTKKLDLSDVPNLDDIELPKIKNLVSHEEDIWKF